MAATRELSQHAFHADRPTRTVRRVHRPRMLPGWVLGAIVVAAVLAMPVTGAHPLAVRPSNHAPAAITPPRIVVTVGSRPVGVTYDPANHDLYVMNGQSASISVINSKGVVVTTIAVGTGPRAAAYDPANHLLYVACSGSGNVTIVNTSSNTVVGTVTGVGSAWEVAYDP